MIVDLIDVTHLTGKQITLLAEIQAECFPDPTEIENEREKSQDGMYVRCRANPTPLARKCLENNEARCPWGFYDAKPR